MITEEGWQPVSFPTYASTVRHRRSAVVALLRGCPLIPPTLNSRLGVHQLECEVVLPPMTSYVYDVIVPKIEVARSRSKDDRDNLCMRIALRMRIALILRI